MSQALASEESRLERARMSPDEMRATDGDVLHRYVNANELAANERYRDAATELAPIAEAVPSAAALQMWFSTLSKDRTLVEGTNAARQVVEAYPDLVVPRFVLTACLVAQGELEEARGGFEDLKRLQPMNDRVHFLEALIAMGHDQLDAALSAVEALTDSGGAVSIGLIKALFFVASRQENEQVAGRAYLLLCHVKRRAPVPNAPSFWRAAVLWLLGAMLVAAVGIALRPPTLVLPLFLLPATIVIVLYALIGTVVSSRPRRLLIRCELGLVALWAGSFLAARG